MNSQSGILLHMGINYLLTPLSVIDKRRFLAFQTALINEGIEYDEAKHTEREINLLRQNSPLQIRVIISNSPLGQILVAAPRPEGGLEMFGRQAQAVIEAFAKTWPEAKQVVTCDGTVRYLFESDASHAFEEIWETRLKQSKAELAIFDTPVGGGGLRFVLPAMVNQPDPAEIELKIESYLQNPKKIFVDVRFKWLKAKPVDDGIDPADRLRIIDRFVEEKVIAFMRSDTPENNLTAD